MAFAPTTKITIIQAHAASAFPKSTACAKTKFGYKGDVAN
jgi:hypothetical protein